MAWHYPSHLKRKETRLTHIKVRSLNVCVWPLTDSPAHQPFLPAVIPLQYGVPEPERLRGTKEYAMPDDLAWVGADLIEAPPA
jgi:hypothetical protein